MANIVRVIRHGDVNLLPINEIPSGGEEIKPIDGDKTVLAFGEVTGHAHVLPYSKAKQYRVGEKEYLKVTKEAVLRHGDLHTGANPDHDPLIIPVGNYEKVIAREEDPSGLIKRVVD